MQRISKRGLLNRDKGLIGTWILYGNRKSTKALARTLQIMQPVKQNVGRTAVR